MPPQDAPISVKSDLKGLLALEYQSLTLLDFGRHDELNRVRTRNAPEIPLGMLEATILSQRPRRGGVRNSDRQADVFRTFIGRGAGVPEARRVRRALDLARIAGGAARGDQEQRNHEQVAIDGGPLPLPQKHPRHPLERQAQ